MSNDVEAAKVFSACSSATRMACAGTTESTSTTGQTGTMFNRDM